MSIAHNAINLVGQKYGNLIVTGQRRTNGRTYLTCSCDCGNTKTVALGNIRNGHTTSCGCNRKGNGNKVDITGNKYGRLTVLSENGRISNQVAWLCKCDCGNETTVASNHLRTGHTKSCGCSWADFVPHNKTHGMAGSPEFKTWVHMRQRCDNPKDRSYRHYGGRGIITCERWETFEHFLEDMGLRPSPRHSIDRIDVNGGYEPSNCRWALPKVQANNTRSNRYITIEEKTKTLSEWCDYYGVVPASVVGRRLKRGWEVKQALTAPLR